MLDLRLNFICLETINSGLVVCLKNSETIIKKRQKIVKEDFFEITPLANDIFYATAVQVI